MQRWACQQAPFLICGSLVLLVLAATVPSEHGWDPTQQFAFVSGTSGHRFTMRRVRNYDQGRWTRLIHQLETAHFVEPTSRMCETWAVITTINPPTKTIQQLAAIPDLCVCVVGDRKTPLDFQLPGVTYLSPDMQKKLSYGIARLLPWNHFGRKNIGYLYAIHHGARAIYDADDDNELLDGLTKLPYIDEVDRSILKHLHVSADSEHVAVNLYPLFGANMSWPRGFPLDQIRQSVADPLGTFEDAESTGAMKVGVIQSLVNYDPDVDAVYRLSTLTLPFNFAAKEPGLVGLPPRTHVMPFNAQATLHFHHAFWGMLLPTTVHGRVSDIWRSYFTQRLLWETDGAPVVAFASPWVIQHRNAHNYLSDFQAEGHLYERSTALVEYLFRTWQCGAEEKSIAQCTLQLYRDMYEHDIVEAADVELVAQWIADLRAVGYSFPRRALQPVSVDHSSFQFKLHHASIGSNRSLPALFMDEWAEPVLQQLQQPLLTERVVKGTTAIDSGIIKLVDEYRAEPSNDGRGVNVTAGSPFPSAAANTEAWADFYEDADWLHHSDVPAQPVIVGHSSLQLNLWNVSLGSARYLSVRYVDDRGRPVLLRLKQPLVTVPVFHDVLMVIHLNYGHLSSLLNEFLDVYGQAFPNHVAISSSNPGNLSAAAASVPFHVVPETRQGWAMPIALKYAMQRYPGYRGYLLVNNDVSFRFWKWGRFDRDRVWAAKCEVGSGWDPNEPALSTWHWPTDSKTGFLKAFCQSLSEQEQRQALVKGLVVPCGSDLFYVPSRYQDQFVRYVDQLGNVWSKTALFEAAVPIVLSLVAPRSEWQPIKGEYCWGGDRTQACPEEFIKDETVDFVHPWKLGDGNRHPFSALMQQGQAVFLPV